MDDPTVAVSSSRTSGQYNPKSPVSGQENSPENIQPQHNHTESFDNRRDSSNTQTENTKSTLQEDERNSIDYDAEQQKSSQDMKTNISLNCSEGDNQMQNGLTEEIPPEVAKFVGLKDEITAKRSKRKHCFFQFLPYLKTNVGVFFSST